MSTRPVVYRVVLSFTAGGPALEGQWESEEIARRTFRDWVGLYGGTAATTVQLVEEETGHVLKSWPPPR